MANQSLKTRLETAHPIVFALFATAVTFCTYTCMYAFRKPFTATDFAGSPEVMGLTYKSLLVITQVIGYALSKFIGIKVVSEMGKDRRAIAILVLIGIAELALLGFALVPAPYNFFFLFFNGLPLGMIWGIVFSFVEGRKLTEVIGLGLCASFIFASGFVKDVGKALMSAGVSEFWMPFTTGLVFTIPLLFFAYMLRQMPPPSAEDEALRTKRVPMDGADRKAFFLKFAIGLTLLVIVYTVLTAYRDFRDNFLADIWIDLQGAGNDQSFSATETPVSIAVLVVLMLIVLIKDNFKALMVNHVAIFAGVLTAGIATWGHQAGWVNDFFWILLTGVGTYLAYIPFNSILFDRMIATFKHVSNVGFLIYVADAFGYLGSVGVLIYKDFGAKNLSWVEFFTGISYTLAGLGTIGLIFSMIYFSAKAKRFR